MKKLFLFLSLSMGSLLSARATNYYVSSGSDGNDGNPGTTLAAPFKTIQKAADLTNPGDVVYVRAGTYTNNPNAGSVVTIRRSGTPANWITYRNYPGDQAPLLRFNTWNGFGIVDGASYVEISGFRIQGNNGEFNNPDGSANTTAGLNQPAGCTAQGQGNPDPRYLGGGISAEGRPDHSTGHPHHLRISGNEVFDCGTAGISAIQCDYVTVENNLVYNNAWYSIYGGSGISILAAWNYDQTTGTRTIVRNNRVFGNRLYVPWYDAVSATCKGITDGNGIIIDSNDELAYSGRTLVANNLVVNNGGGGVVVFASSHVDVINNTAYYNGQSPELTGNDLSTTFCKDVLAQNNIAYAAPGEKLNAPVESVNVTYNGNLFFGGTGSTNQAYNNTNFVNTNVTRADPQFTAPTTDWRTADFTLRATSPAIDKGINNLLSTTDLAGNPRVAGALPDLGAYEKLLTLRNPEDPANTLAGLDYQYYQGTWTALPNFTSLTPAKTGTVTGFDLTPATLADYFGFKYTGYVIVPTDGVYTFYTSSDDGSQFFIGSTLVVNNDGLHGSAEQSGTIGLKAGRHAITVTYFEAAGDNVLNVSYQGPGLAKQAIPASALYRDTPPRPPEDPANTLAGLDYQYYQGTWTRCLTSPASRRPKPAR